MNGIIRNFAGKSKAMETATLSQPNNYPGVSSVDALWALIIRQPKSIRKTLTERLLTADIEVAEQLLLKASIEKGWQQVKAMQQNEAPSDSLQDLIDELRKD